MPLEYTIHPCPCGKEHVCSVEHVVIEEGALQKIPHLLQLAGAYRPFLVMDQHTRLAAGDQVMRLLDADSIDYHQYTYPAGDIEPNEPALGRVMMAFDPHCDFIIAIGSGVINDICKMLARVTRLRYMIVATAPSMDGFASPSSSLDQEGVKVSLSSATAWAIVGDLAVLRNAPTKLLLAGFGDMLAKFTSICEWRIAHIITGEYYCETVATITRDALRTCMQNAPKLLSRDSTATKSVMEGLVLSGIAMAYAGVSRPASGMEHYISHLIDMRTLAFGTPADLHGTQVGVGTLATLKLYEKIRTLRPNRDKALQAAAAFDYALWTETLRGFVGPGTDMMVALERRDHKYDLQAHAKRLDTIIANWDRITAIIDEELPRYEDIHRLMTDLGMPVTVDEVGLEAASLPLAIKCTKDIRDKYMASRLLWDLGELD